MKNYSFKSFEENKNHAKRNKITNILDGQNLIMFFSKDERFFGAPEESRIVFAKMKDPEGDEDMPDNWEDEANFMAFDLMHSLIGQNTQNIFSAKDLSKIKVLDRDHMEKHLMQCPDANVNIKIKKNLDNIGAIKLKDEK
jgi:hypothetical protein